MTDPVPSKECDYLSKLQDSHPMVQLQREIDELRRENRRWENAHKILLSENDRLRKQVGELSVHAEKWVTKALQLQEQIATLKGYISRTALAGYRCAECAERLAPEPRDVSAEFTRLRERESKVSGIYERAIVLRMDLEDLLHRAAQPPGAGQ